MFTLPWEPLKSKEMNMSMKNVFFVRLSGNKDDGVYVSLYETDGGAWKNDAAKAIKEFVEERTGDLGIPVYC